MSVHMIYYNKDGAKMMRPILKRENYMALRDSATQKLLVRKVRNGEEKLKTSLIQMNYSCLPNEDGSLKGSSRMSSMVGMDIDHIKPEEMEAVKERILQKKEELGLKMLEKSARGEGYHLVFRRREKLSQEDNLKWASELLGVKFDEGAKDITRVFFTTAGSDLIYLDDEIFEIVESKKEFSVERLEVSDNSQSAIDLRSSSYATRHSSNEFDSALAAPSVLNPEEEPASPALLMAFDLCAKQAGLNPDRMDVWGERNWHTNLMAMLSLGIGKLMKREQLRAVVAVKMPNYSKTEDCQKLINYFYDKYDANEGFMNAGLREINAKTQDGVTDGELEVLNENGNGNENDEHLSIVNSQLSIKKMPMGVRDSIDAVGSQLAMPVVTAICPCIGALATGVVLDVHGRKKGLNLIAYIAGDFASGKGDIDPVVDAWMSEVQALDKMYQMQEDEWRAKKRAAKNKKEQPEEPKLPVRCLTLNNTVANLAERLSNTEGKHAFSFTPEADTVAQKWKSTLSDFSVMLRQSYDGSRFDREARSAEAVNVHIEHLLWNVTMCGTPDALYRVVSNYTDGFQSRIAVARTPDNTFAPLEEKPYVLTSRQAERIQQVAHLLPLMQGEAVLPKLEAKGREWVERIRIETMMNDDKVRARQRMRVCVTAQRMTCCLMLCKVCELLIQKHGLNGAESRLKQNPNLWKEMLLKTQTPSMLAIYDVIADSLMESALFYFRERIEAAYNSKDYAGSQNGERLKRGKNDSIFARLDHRFTFEQAMQQSIAIKGTGVTRNSVKQMLKNWRYQGLVVYAEDGSLQKILQ